MNRNIILIALLCLLSIGRTVAQSVTVEAKIDSLQILIGEQAKVQLQVAMDAKQRAVFPRLTQLSIIFRRCLSLWMAKNIDRKLWH